MVKKIELSEPGWGSYSITLHCYSCKYPFSCYDKDGRFVAFWMEGATEDPYLDMPTEECPRCGNRGQDLIACRSCNRMYPMDAYIEHGSDAGYCPACCNNEETAGPFYRRGHEFVDDGNGRCKTCTEAERHYVHEEDEEDDE